jgi:tRNA uridine 5-carboxymethylaminomethyl modification enzyme
MVEQPGDDPRPVMSFMGSIADHPRTGQLLDHPHQRAHPPDHPRRAASFAAVFRADRGRRPALLPVASRTRWCASPRRPATRSSSSPKAWTVTEIYPNGISTSLPFDVQLDLVRSITRLRAGAHHPPGYAIEYDYFDPRGLKPSLETKAVAGLFFAGPDQRHHRLRGSRAQGLLAGVNAARFVQERAAGRRAATRPTWACWSTT